MPIALGFRGFVLHIHRVKRNVRAAILSFIALVSTIANARSQTPLNDRADVALQSFLLKFWDGNRQYFLHRYPSDGQLTGYWTYANGWDAILDSVERTGRTRYLGLIDTLYLGQNERGWSSDYYDDECWMCMALLRAYDLTSDPKYLSRAQSIFVDVQNAWDTTCCGSPTGGVGGIARTPKKPRPAMPALPSPPLAFIAAPARLDI